MHRLKGHLGRESGGCLNSARSTPLGLTVTDIAFMKVCCLKGFLMKVFSKDIWDYGLEGPCVMVIFNIGLLQKMFFMLVC